MKVGANEFCPCGSGNKYKRCCRNKSIDIWTLWRNNATSIAVENGLDNPFAIIFCTLLKFISNYRWTGACHGTSAILYVILQELGYEPKLCAGVISTEFWMSGHSWVEVNGKVYDVSCYFPTIGIAQMMPVFHGKELDSMNNTKTLYGISNAPYDKGVEIVLNKSVSQVMAGCHEELGNANLWQVLGSVCVEANASTILSAFDIRGNKMDVSEMAKKYDLAGWKHICDKLNID